MSRGEQQRLFFSLACQWGLAIQVLGYEATFGEARRTDEQAEINALGPALRNALVVLLRRVPMFEPLAKAIANNTGSGIRNSLHIDGLALDVNLFSAGTYQADGASPAWVAAGKLWESLHPLCRWGGRFGDGNHLSMEFEGRK